MNVIFTFKLININNKIKIEYNDNLIVFNKKELNYKNIKVEKLDSIIDIEKDILIFTNTMYIERNIDIFKKSCCNTVTPIKSEKLKKA